MARRLRFHVRVPRQLRLEHAVVTLDGKPAIIAAKVKKGRDGNFYGTTRAGGSSDRGTVFKVTTNGVLTMLASFSGTNGEDDPRAGLVLGSDGHFYGTIQATVFRVTTNGVLTTVVTFTAPNGAGPNELVLGDDGNFYRTTAYGGSGYFDPAKAGYGTVFKLTTNGLLTTLASFSGTNGAIPQAGLVLGNDGDFYGTTANGGPGGGGTIFRLVISAFTSVARQPGGSVLLTGTGPANGSYRLWDSADLSLPAAAWTVLTSASFDSSGNFTYTDASAATNSSRFYQLSVP